MIKRKILIVDDNPQIGDLLSVALSSEYEILRAKSGEEAIKKAVLDRPNCILLDVMMPEMGGFMVCEILKSIKQTQLIPILVVSGKPREELLPMVMEMGAMDYIQKPFSIDQILKAVNHAMDTAPLERRRTPRVPMRIPIIVRGKDVFSNEFEVTSDTEDVSRFGALVKLPVRVNVGDLVELRPRASPSQDVGVSYSQARVVWGEEEPIPGHYRYGLEFTTPSAHWVIQH